MILTKITASPSDIRDIPFVPSKQPVPTKVDLREWVSLIEDQLTIGSCTANATTSLIELLAKRWGISENLSRLFLYYVSRQDEGRLGQDGLQTLRSALHAGYRIGFCLEDEWPYVLPNTDTKPLETCYTSAITRLITKYERVGIEWWQNPVASIKAALAEGLPVVIAMTVNNQIYGLKGPLKDQVYETKDKFGKRFPLDGAHAVTIVGYDDDIQGFIYVNSWGTGWGENGYGRLEYRNIGEVFEAWVVRGYKGMEIPKPVDPVPEPVTPTPVPVPEPTPEPIPVPPAPAPEPEPLPVSPAPEPQPAPVVKKKDDKVLIFFGAVVACAILTKVLGFW